MSNYIKFVIFIDFETEDEYYLIKETFESELGNDNIRVLDITSYQGNVLEKTKAAIRESPIPVVLIIDNGLISSLRAIDFYYSNFVREIKAMDGVLLVDQISSKKCIDEEDISLLCYNDIGLIEEKIENKFGIKNLKNLKNY